MKRYRELTQTGSVPKGERELTMPDRDSVINGLDEIMRYNGEQMFYNDIFIRGIAEDALVLLKKQEAQKFFVDESGKITPLPVVVRCKDCKHRNNSLLCPVALLAETVMKTRVFDFKVSDDWFCADGERRADT